MAIIQNPEKSFTVDASVEQIKKIINRVPEFAKGGKLISSDDFICQYEFEFSTLKVGNVITVSLNSVDDNKTEIKLEARRILGAFNNQREVMEADLDFKNITKALSKLIQNPDVAKPEKKGCAGSATILVILLVSLVFLF